MKDKRKSSGNIYFLLFASVGLVAAAALSVQSYILGPLKTANIVNTKSALETQMDISMRVAKTQMAANNCDADPLFEPLAPEASASFRPTGGGLLPMTIAGATTDPWGSRYGYCVWDHGTSNNNAGGTCAAQGVRLQGTTLTTFSSMVIISAGPNRAFETTCNGWVDTTPADGQPDTPLVQKAVGDDVVLDWSYDTATGGCSASVCTAETWTARAAAEANAWNSVTYGNGLFVAVSSDGTNRVMTSPDGITWTARAASSGAPFISVTYGGGLFVAVALDGDVMTSPDGITWTGRSPAALSNWYSVTYGNGLFVAVAEGGTDRVMTSPDGITWTARTAAEANAWRSVIYGNGLYVAVSNDGTNRVMTSPDGITWTARTAAQANQWFSVTYGNGLFVAVSENGTNRVMTSPDGITWTARTAAQANQWLSVTYANNLFVAVSPGAADSVMTSPDGITWTAQTAPESNFWRSVTYGNGLFVAIAENGTNRVMTSSCSSGGCGGGSELWTDLNPVAEIAKNISVKDGASAEQFLFNPSSVALTIGAGGSGEFPTLRTDTIEELTGPADPNDDAVQMMDPILFPPEDGSGTTYGIQSPNNKTLNFSDSTKTILGMDVGGAGALPTDAIRIFDPPSAGTGGVVFSEADKGMNLISSIDASHAMNFDMTNLDNDAAAVPKPNKLHHNIGGVDVNRLSLNLETNGATATNIAGNITFSTRPTGVVGNPAPIERMRIEGGGDVGIGITNPTARLHVVGNVVLGDVSGNVGVNTSTVPEKLNINGALRVGSGAEACTAPREGAFRFTTCIEMCNGVVWSCVLNETCNDSSDSGSASSPYVSQINATASTLTNSVTVHGLSRVSAACSLEVSISGPGSPEYRICNDTACTSVVQTWTSGKSFATNGHDIQLRATSPAGVGEQYNISVKIGADRHGWILGTAGDCTVAAPPIGTLCADGTMYMGLSPDGWTKMYTTPCPQGQTLSSGSCTGVASNFAWSNQGTTTGTASNNFTGEANTTALVALIGARTFAAASQCDSLSFGGHTDWYLPASAEAMNFLAACNYHPFHACDEAVTDYWTSLDSAATTAGVWWPSYNSEFNFFFNSVNKTSTRRVRCVRKD